MSLATLSSHCFVSYSLFTSAHLSCCRIYQKVGNFPDDIGQGQQGEMVDIATRPVPQSFHCQIICGYCKKIECAAILCLHCNYSVSDQLFPEGLTRAQTPVRLMQWTLTLTVRGNAMYKTHSLLSLFYSPEKNNRKRRLW